MIYHFSIFKDRLDCRYLITHLLLRNLLFEHATLHHGSPFMDWCRDNIGVGEINQTLSSLSSIPQTTYTILHPITRALIQAFDTPAYSTGNLTTDYCVNYFNNPNNPSVAYYRYSYGASTNIIKEKEGPNDGLVSVKSAQCGKYMGTVECDHWDLTNNRWRLKIDTEAFSLTCT
ncbi:hypothetical protein C2G38_2134084 [Gigaspora rosea]|uniref:Uncharacterized protein n=1 Tax=Gigaspora rosea TaxID=44941 RepID=A0A397VQV1_9GLOM|nr:hypothetical protein C2G38_2134084 [Gigaspora rosea]